MLLTDATFRMPFSSNVDFVITRLHYNKDLSVCCSVKNKQLIDACHVNVLLATPATAIQ